ncbi:MAG: RNA-guided endonuclease InsQ/TnpB family protein [Promethearchaeota archaeon]
MQLVQRILLKPTPQLKELAIKTNSLYNYANYNVRQAFFHQGKWTRYTELNKLLKNTQVYKQLPIQTSQQILRLLDKNWKAFFVVIKDYYVHPEKYLGRPKPPKYRKRHGQFIVIFTGQQCRLKKGELYLPKRACLPPVKLKLPFSLFAVSDKIAMVRIIPKGVAYVLEVVYEAAPINYNLDPGRIIGIDLGMSNLATIANNVGLMPLVIRGGALKSINQMYNKELAKYKSIYARQGYMTSAPNSRTNSTPTSTTNSNTAPVSTANSNSTPTPPSKNHTPKRVSKLLLKRENKIADIFHKASRKIIDYCVSNNIGTIVVGYNENWKQKSSIGKVNNQNFVSIPFYKFVTMLEYKAKLAGINLIKVEESYTSKCSFLDDEAIGKKARYKGRRVQRGLFKSSDGRLINADVNGAYNIIRKAVPDAFADGIEGVGLHPSSIAI